ncbi:hypothetical protein PHMEG_00038891 [Phytophthora megakarya]|uniref:Uncharacterized protein n=1 Tax=Phytophthora megakarya TaxID=4795 RepID=A0A225UJ94_9STRA|nr:hypothetical protein PHMEG_00038891 [Phytophthora megakarya]
METTSDKDGVGMMKQIGRQREKDLNDADIFTIGDLRTRLKMKGIMPENLSSKCLHKMLSHHGESRQWSKLHHTFDSIPQYVWGVDSKYV